MNLRMFAPLALILALPACSGNPLGNVPEPEAPVVVVPEPGTDGGLTRDGLPPGTTNPSRSSSITRYEATDGTSGSGFVTNVNYNAANDTFAVADLPFDGNGVYTRGVAVRQLNASQTMPYAVYESAPTANDNLTGGVIGQLQHRAIFAVSTSGQTEFAIVRTGSYVGYGFGGFLYKRNGNVTLPTTGQASYAGDYAGIRDFEGTSGMEYATGAMSMDIEFDGFGAGNAAVKGRISNCRIFDINGNDITGQVLSALSTETGVSQGSLPTLVFDVGPGVMDVNGEITGQLGSALNTTSGREDFETGNYYAILSGNNAQEVVGIVVVTADDPRFGNNVTVRETGGFILTRP